MVNDTAVTLVGWLGGDPSLSSVGDGHQVANFRLATNVRRFRDGEWQTGPTSWFTVKVWGRLAEHCAESLRSGQPVVVHGRLTVEVWQRDDGTSTTRYVVVATSVGHDLARGTSVFTAPPSDPHPGEQVAPATQQEVADEPPEEVVDGRAA